MGNDWKIRYLRQEEHEKSRALYEEVFAEDEEAFVDAYYRIKAADNRILVAEDAGEIVSMLHRNPYTFRLRGRLAAADYLVAVATRSSYRHRGLMRSLLTKALRDMEGEKMPFTFLMPASEAIYTPFDFRFMGNRDEEGMARLSREELAAACDLYVEKDGLYEKRHIFWPEWEATPMMIRLLHLPSFLKSIGAEEATRLVIAVEDPILADNNRVFRWELKRDTSELIPVTEEPELRISIADLGSFLCGQLRAEELPGIREEEEAAEILAKLQKIHVLKSIYINEIV